MLLTCLSPSPSCSFPPLFLSLLTFPLFASDALSLSPPLSGEGETRGAYCYPNISPPPENLRLDIWEMRSSGVATASEAWEQQIDLQYLCRSDFGVYASETESVLVTPACFRSLTAARISRFPPQLALSKKNTLDRFQTKVWQLFHFKLRLWQEENIEMNSTS